MKAPFTLAALIFAAAITLYTAVQKARLSDAAQARSPEPSSPSKASLRPSAEITNEDQIRPEIVDQASEQFIATIAELLTLSYSAREQIAQLTDALAQFESLSTSETCIVIARTLDRLRTDPDLFSNDAIFITQFLALYGTHLDPARLIKTASSYEHASWETSRMAFPAWLEQDHQAASHWLATQTDITNHIVNDLKWFEAVAAYRRNPGENSAALLSFPNRSGTALDVLSHSAPSHQAVITSALPLIEDHLTRARLTKDLIKNSLNGNTDLNLLEVANAAFAPGTPARDQLVDWRTYYAVSNATQADTVLHIPANQDHAAWGIAHQWAREDQNLEEVTNWINTLPTPALRQRATDGLLENLKKRNSPQLQSYQTNLTP